MRSCRELKPLYKRDRAFNIVYYIALSIPVLVFATTMLITIRQASSGYLSVGHDDFVAFDLYAIYYSAIFGILLIIMQCIRWKNYEKDKEMWITQALPISKKNHQKYDLKMGYVPIIYTNIMCLIVLCMKSYDYARNLYFEEIRPKMMWNCFAHDTLGVIAVTLTLLILYTLLVLAKNISKNITWAVIFWGTVAAMVGIPYYGIFVEIIAKYTSNLQKSEIMNLGDNIITSIYYYNLYELIFIIISLIPIYVLVRSLLSVATKRIDEAKHGAYYFKTAQFLVCIALAIIVFGSIMDVEINIFSANYVFSIIVALVVAGIVFVGMYLLSRQKNGKR